MDAKKFSEHLIFERLEQLRETLNAENAIDIIGVEDYNFMESFYSYTSMQLKLVLFTLVTEKELNAISSEINAGVPQLNAFLGSKNQGHLTNALNNFNSALSRVTRLPIPITKKGFDYSGDISNFQKTIKEAYESINKQNEELKESLKLIEKDLQAKNDLVIQLQSQLSTKEVEIQNVLSQYNTEFEKIKSSNNTVFENERTRFNSEIEADRKRYQEEIEKEKNTFKEAFEKQISDLQNETKSTIENLKQKLEEAKKIVNIVGNVGVTGNYQKIASEHKTTANTFRWISIGIMIVMSGLLIWTIIDLSKDGFDLYKSIVRIVAATILTYPAIYASKESSRHRVLETKNRNLELELASLGPFIELLSEDKKEKIKEDLVYRYFGNGLSEENVKESEEDVSINGLEKIIKAMLPLIKK
ncbi:MULTISPECIES: hypothetical protein [unclassified Myroides]|uniref:hypothetical protein n=1 Tax=unclassified Myroides TaxID=2642485 RepID=UPI003D2F7930